MRGFQTAITAIPPFLITMTSCTLHLLWSLVWFTSPVQDWHIRSHWRREYSADGSVAAAAVLFFSRASVERVQCTIHLSLSFAHCSCCVGRDENPRVDVGFKAVNLTLTPTPLCLQTPDFSLHFFEVQQSWAIDELTVVISCVIPHTWRPLLPCTVFLVTFFIVQLVWVHPCGNVWPFSLDRSSCFLQSLLLVDMFLQSCSKGCMKRKIGHNRLLLLLLLVDSGFCCCCFVEGGKGEKFARTNREADPQKMQFYSRRLRVLIVTAVKPLIIQKATPTRDHLPFYQF